MSSIEHYGAEKHHLFAIVDAEQADGQARMTYRPYDRYERY